MTHHEDAYDARMGKSGQVASGKVATTVLHVGGLGWASEKAVVERVLGRRPGVRLVEANPVWQTATVTFDTARTSVAELRRWVEECGYHCAGQSVPSHVCDPMAEPDRWTGTVRCRLRPQQRLARWSRRPLAVQNICRAPCPEPVNPRPRPVRCRRSVAGTRWLPGRACRLRRR